MTATTATQLYTLDKEAFLAAVTGHAPTYSTADRLVSDRLAPARRRPEDFPAALPGRPFAYISTYGPPLTMPVGPSPRERRPAR